MAKGRAWTGIVAAVLTAGGAAGLALLGQRLINPGRDYSPEPSYRPSSDSPPRRDKNIRITTRVSAVRRRDGTWFTLSTLPLSHLGGQSDAGSLLINNRCHRDVLISLAYQEQDGWETFEGEEWRVQGNQSAFLQVDGRLLVTRTPVIYYAARSADGVDRWTGHEPIPVNGRTINMKPALFEAMSSRRSLSLSCDAPQAQSNAPAAAN